MSRKRKHSEITETKGEEAANESQEEAGKNTEESKDNTGSSEAKKKKNKCGVCKKKVGLTGVECRCGGLFCGLHRYTDKHDCTFNYKEMGASEIRKNNPVVVRDKINKI